MAGKFHFYVAEFWQKIFPKIVFNKNAAIRTGGEIGWMLRKDSPQLKAELNAFLTRHPEGSARRNQLLQKYWKNTKYVKDARGHPTGFHLTPGPAHDVQEADALWPALLSAIRAFLADRADNAEKRVLALLEKAGVQAVIPPKAHRKQPREYDEHLYKERALIEHCFAKLRPFRAMATRLR